MRAAFARRLNNFVPMTKMPARKRTVVGILTALPDVELPAALRVFGRPADADCDRIIEGERYWFANVTTTRGERIDVVISCMGLSGNTEAGIPTDRMIRNHKPEFLLFVGIGCGDRKFALGDVVTSEAIWAYEYLKTTPAGALDRSRAKITPAHVRDDISFFNKLEAWHETLDRCMDVLTPALRPRVPFVSPTLHRSVWIASGEKVLANNELVRLRSTHDLIRAGEMEGYGFAIGCEDRRPPIPWLVVRGISDYGDTSKDGAQGSEGPMKDEYHHAAASSAAAFARSFLESGYTSSVHGEFDRIPATKRTRSTKDPDRAAGPSVLDREGIRGVFSSDFDPGFSQALLSRMGKAQRQVVMVGMGLSFLKGNTELVAAAAAAVRKQPTLTLSIICGDPAYNSILSRVREEEAESKRAKKAYNIHWPQDHLESILKSFRHVLLREEYARVSISTADCLPTMSIVRIDNTFFWYCYGTPNIRGKESPWILLERPRPGSYLRRFLESNLEYYMRQRRASLLTGESEEQQP